MADIPASPHRCPHFATVIAKLRASGFYDLPPVQSPFGPHSTTQSQFIDAKPIASAPNFTGTE